MPQGSWQRTRTYARHRNPPLPRARPSFSPLTPLSHHRSALAVTIQRWYRGHLGRRRFHEELEAHMRRVRIAYFDAHATTIQRHFRGWHSRRYRFDFRKRKAYLIEVHAKAQEVRELLAQEALRSTAALQQGADEQAMRTFERKAATLHHLLSTKAQPGIFNSPFSVATGTLPAIGNVPLEQHLAATAKAAIKTKLPALTSSPRPRAPPTPPDVLANGEPYNPRASVRQSSPFGNAREAEEFERKLGKLRILQLHAAPFDHVATVVKRPPLESQTLRNMEPFTGVYNPTLGTKPVDATSMQRRSLSLSGGGAGSGALSPTMTTAGGGSTGAKPFNKYAKGRTYFDKNFCDLA